MDTSDSRYVASQYASEANLQIRINTHRHYALRPGADIFDQVTQAMAQVQGHPTKILDVGPGTGTWYRTLRGALGPLPFYTGIDQSEGMIASLRQILAGDSRSEAMVGDAETLPWPDDTFSWAGLHFMLYHVPDIARALSEAFRVLKPGGVLTACTNGRQPYPELWELGDQVAHDLGLPGAAPHMSDRFNLTNGAAFFPDRPRVYRFTGGFRFPQSDPAVRYMASGPVRSHLGEAADDPDVTTQALSRLADLIEERIAKHGVFEVHSSSGFFLLEKPERSMGPE